MDVGNIEKVRMAGLRDGLHMGGKGESVGAQNESDSFVWMMGRKFLTIHCCGKDSQRA